MLGILFSLMPLIGWGIGDYVSSRMSKTYHPAAINLFFSITIGIIVTSVCVFFGLPELTLNAFLGFVLISLLLSGGFISMLKGFETGATGIVAPIANAYAIITLAVSVLFLESTITAVAAGSILIVVAGIALLSYEKSPTTKTLRDRKMSKAVGFSLLAMMFFGFGFASYDVFATQLWYQNAILSEIANIPVAILIYVFWVRKNRMSPLRKVISYKFGYIASLISGIAFLGLFLALENTDNVAIPASIAAASPLVTVFLARIYDHEKLTIVQRLGGVIVVLGIVLLSLGS